ncbi:MAG: hypothetical protein AAB663_01880 [Patescibacteria group bacterium]
MHSISRLFATGIRWLGAHRGVVFGVACSAAVIALAVFVPMHFALADHTLGHVDTAANGGLGEMSFIILIAQIFNGIANMLGKLTLTLIGIILIPILNYDGFATSQIVGLGWSLVRDTVNMFVVVVLLVIAVLTIVGSPKVNWQQQIPRLFIYVVMVNFSRTICGFLIDIGNVIMFQFVNALVEIGAGNFAELLKLNIAGDISTADGVLTTGAALQSMTAAFLQVSLMTMVVAIVGIIVIVFMYRIVLLWVLIIMSPAAFFLGGVKDVFAQAGGMYSEWWKKFSSAIIIGPILSFFLWLALAASAGGDIVTSENFPMGDTENFGTFLKVFDMSHLTGLLLGVILLVVGLKLASTSAAGMGDFAAKFVNEGVGYKLAKAGLKWPSTAASGAYKAAETVAPETTARASAYALQKGGEGISGLSAQMGNVAGKVPIVGGIGAMAFRKVSQQGNKMYAAGVHIDEEQKKKAREELKHAPPEYQREVMDSMARDDATAGRGNAFSGMSKWQQEVMFEDLATKTSSQKAALAAFTPKNATDAQKEEAQKKFDALMKQVIDKTQRDLDKGHSDLDDNQKTAFKATKSQHVDLLFDVTGLNPADAAERIKEANKYVEDTESGFDPRLVRARALNGARGATNLEGVRDAMNRRVVEILDDGSQVTALHQAERGKYGRPISDAAATGSSIVPHPYVAPGTYGANGWDPRNPARTAGGAPTPTPPTTAPPRARPTPPVPPGTPPAGIIDAGRTVEVDEGGRVYKFKVAPGDFLNAARGAGVGATVRVPLPTPPGGTRDFIIRDVT